MEFGARSLINRAVYRSGDIQNDSNQQEYENESKQYDARRATSEVINKQIVYPFYGVSDHNIGVANPSRNSETGIHNPARTISKRAVGKELNIL
ncbi:hypothetical protein NPIL_563401 [Nephila pilipes]|uniref:Uncharacterized protein n=1 Tax=Nephila pilipes TaxID=299642 RepID=A0A8X6Q7S1_NEPPI|nr:hypothetical protein NPIL_563401 [Nephila pilipes]